MCFIYCKLLQTCYLNGSMNLASVDGTKSFVLTILITHVRNLCSQQLNGACQAVRRATHSSNNNNNKTNEIIIKWCEKSSSSQNFVSVSVLSKSVWLWPSGWLANVISNTLIDIISLYCLCLVFCLQIKWCSL